jgi:hypothetical protein
MELVWTLYGFAACYIGMFFMNVIEGPKSLVEFTRWLRQSNWTDETSDEEIVRTYLRYKKQNGKN